MKREIRVVTFDKVEIRSKEGEPNKLVGYAAVFNRLSEDLGGFREKIIPGAFSRALKEKQDVRALFNHDPNLILGRNKAGTLRLKEDDTGLGIEIDLPDTTVGRDLGESVKRGDVDQMSFAFSVYPDGETWGREGDMVVRALKDVNLYDVSPVTYPAYPDTTVAVRSLALLLKDAKDNENLEARIKLLEIE